MCTNRKTINQNERTEKNQPIRENNNIHEQQEIWMTEEAINWLIVKRGCIMMNRKRSVKAIQQNEDEFSRKKNRKKIMKLCIKVYLLSTQPRGRRQKRGRDDDRRFGAARVVQNPEAARATDRYIQEWSTPMYYERHKFGRSNFQGLKRNEAERDDMNRKKQKTGDGKGLRRSEAGSRN